VLEAIQGQPHSPAGTARWRYGSWPAFDEGTLDARLEPAAGQAAPRLARAMVAAAEAGG
jgi:hypothetical protein